MVNRWRHWCPSGKCGKSVVYRGWGSYKNVKINKPYICDTCGKQYSKEEVEEELI